MKSVGGREVVDRATAIERVTFSLQYCMEVIKQGEALDPQQVAEVRDFAAEHGIKVDEVVDFLMSDSEQIGAMFADRSGIQLMTVSRLRLIGEHEVFTPVERVVIDECGCAEADCRLCQRPPHINFAEK